MAPEVPPARAALLHAVAALLEALQRDDAVAVLRGLSPRDMQPGGARVPGTSYELAPALAAQVMVRLAALAGTAAPTLFAALAQGDAAARQALVRGSAPPVVASLYPHCAGVAQPPLAAGFEGGVQRLAEAVQACFTPSHARRLRVLLGQWQDQPQGLDELPLQRFVAQFVRNAPP